LILQQRGGSPQVHEALRQILKESPDVTRRLRALWALHVTKGIAEPELTALLQNDNEYLRSWAVQLLCEDRGPSDNVLREFLRMATSDSSALVRLYLAAAMQRTPVAGRWEVLDALYQRDEDIKDHNLPLMLWYAFEPLIQQDANKAISVALRARLPEALKFTALRIAAMDGPEAKEYLKKLLLVLQKDPHNHAYHEVIILINKALTNK